MKTKLIGILNVTPDSFSDGSPDALCVELAVEKALRLRDEGADIIDIGGESTRPGFESVSVEEELARVLLVIRALRIADPSLILSIDTRKPQVVRVALELGVEVLNLHGGLNPEMIDAIGTHRPKHIIVYHTTDIRELSIRDAETAIGLFFDKQLKCAIENRLCAEENVHEVVLLDPGIGFGKTLEQMCPIFNLFYGDGLRGHYGVTFAKATVVGVSRKSHLGQMLKQQLNLDKIPSIQDRLEAGLAEIACVMLLKRQDEHRPSSVKTIETYFIRTHDVLATRRFISAFEWLLQFVAIDLEAPATRNYY